MAVMTEPTAKTERLFLPGGSDDEQEPERGRKPDFFPSSDSEPENAEPPALSSSPAPEDGEQEQEKKRKSHFFVDSDEEVDVEDAVDLDKFLNPHAYAKKRARVQQDPTYAIPAPTQSSGFESAFLGEFIIEDAYSTLSGKNHIKPGDEVFIIRDLPFAQRKGKKGKGPGASSTESSSKSGKGKNLKQSKLTFGSGSLKASTIASKQDDNVIIRLENRVRIGQSY